MDFLPKRDIQNPNGPDARQGLGGVASIGSKMDHARFGQRDLVRIRLETV